MKEHTEKQPIDDLFARKLGDMSIKPSTDAYSRLQARMGQDKREEPVVFWRNPVVQRYMAAAACLLLVTLVGWLYLSSSKDIVSSEAKIASNVSKQKAPRLSKQKQETKVPSALPVESDRPQSMTPAELDQSISEEELAHTTGPASFSSKKVKSQVTNEASQLKADAKDPAITPENESVLAQLKPIDGSEKEEAIAKVVNPSAPVVSERPATNPSLTQNTERVLVVTISEPKALVAARQAAITAVEEKSAVASAEKPETKGGNLWSQVKRIKQGEIFARQNKDDDDNSLISRAYNGLKQNFDKDKSVKQ